ncbi:MAG: glycosyltransferase family 4 protein [Rickettsiaceae bacterium]|nr:glycosyltransferase family 4 protein [Rickettsiaceae bacterium]
MAKILNIMLSRDLGGIQQSFVDYSKALKIAGYDVVSVISTGAKVKIDDPVYRIVNLGNWDILSILQLALIISSFKPDVIIAHGNRAMKFAQKTKSSKSILIGVAHNYSTKCIKECDYIFAITGHLRNYLISQDVPKKKLMLMPNMIDVSSSPYIEQELSDVPVIGVMGRFVKKKGFDFFLYSLSLLKARGVKFKAIIAGGGEEDIKLQELSAKLSLDDTVEFIGWVSNKDDFFDKIDIFCLPSTHEPFGIIVLEAMSYSKPVVSTDSEGPSEMIKDGKTGVLCNVGSAKDMADKLEYLIVNKDLTKVMAKNAYLSICKNYDIKVASRKLHNHLEKILHDPESNKAR